MNDNPIIRLDHYRWLGRSGVRVSPICLGTMTFGSDWGWDADDDTSKAIFDAYASCSGNRIDTANFYTTGTSERLLGEFIGSQRDHFVLSTRKTQISDYTARDVDELTWAINSTPRKCLDFQAPADAFLENLNRCI